MIVLVAAAAETGPYDLPIFLGITALAILIVHVAAVRRRRRSNAASGQFATGGSGTWEGAIDVEGRAMYLPEVEEGFFASLVRDTNQPALLTLDGSGLHLRTSGLVHRRDPHVWSAPWGDIVGAEGRPAGFNAWGRAISTVRLTDVVVTLVGESAQPFLEWMMLDEEDDGDDEPMTAEELAEEAEWRREVQGELGPSWRPGTGLLRFRTSAPDGLIEVITRYARGSLPREEA